jgi:Protein of unknown function (DUF5131)
MLAPVTIPGLDAQSAFCPICKAIVPDSLAAPHEIAHGAALELHAFNPGVHCQSVADLLRGVIAGGESGPDARPADIAWFEALAEQCRRAGVPFFMKQLGGAIDKRDQLGEFPKPLRIRQMPDDESSQEFKFSGDRGR